MGVDEPCRRTVKVIATRLQPLCTQGERALLACESICLPPFFLILSSSLLLFLKRIISCVLKTLHSKPVSQFRCAHSPPLRTKSETVRALL